MALEELARLHIPTTALRSKGWEEFATAQAPHMDFVFTVCDKAAGEVCPAWPGQPITAHWGMPDPAAVRGSEDVCRKAFRDTAILLKRRLDIMSVIPLERLDRIAIQQQAREIGKQ